MKHIYYLFPVLVGALFLSTLPAVASQRGCDAHIKLQDYEPNTVVMRNDDNDEPNLSFTISQMIPMFHGGCFGDKSKQKEWWVVPYFALTAQFGFYVHTRESSPVVGKRFNPKLFVRRWLGDHGNYIDVGYAHESNGQSISTQEAYLKKKADILAKDEREEIANDYLSRGWDYVDVIAKYSTAVNQYGFTNSIYFKGKYFFSNGLLQGEPEEFNDWETDEGKSRSEVDGITIMLKTTNISDQKNSRFKGVLLYTTGYESIFEYNTVGVELTFKPGDWPPFFLWASKGYKADLSDYYKDITSFGFGVELRNFLDDY
ncbi:MAG: hypothetical protein OEM02_06635 [Desulfobulbaceae bacterium]|nr:hypothetical protein [Desulfobulbaceae bacterium]